MKGTNIIFFSVIIFFLIPFAFAANSFNESDMDCLSDTGYSTDGFCVKTPIVSPSYELADGVGYVMQNFVAFLGNITYGYVLFLGILAVSWFVMWLFYWLKVYVADSA